MTIILKKESTIQFMKGSEHQCKDINYPEFQYTVIVTMPYYVLDDRGFSIDQTEIHKRIVEHFRDKEPLSCELMAANIHGVINKLAAELRVKILSLSVKIQSVPVNEKTTITINSILYESQ